MGKGGHRADSAQQVYTWDDVRQHDSASDKWIVINDDVYNVTEWAKRHPGGYRIISHYAGQDATVSWQFIVVCHLYIVVVHRCHLCYFCLFLLHPGRGLMMSPQLGLF